jgi:hypothetical protein
MKMSGLIRHFLPFFILGLMAQSPVYAQEAGVELLENSPEALDAILSRPDMSYPEDYTWIFLEQGDADNASLVIYYGYRGGLTPLNHLKALSAALHGAAIPFRFAAPAELWSTGLAFGPPMLEQSAEKGLPALLLSGNIDKASLEKALEGFVPPDDAGSTHYLTLNYKDQAWYISETALAGTALIFWCIGAGLMLRKGVSKRARAAIAAAMLALALGLWMGINVVLPLVWTLLCAGLASFCRKTLPLIILGLLSQAWVVALFARAQVYAGTTGLELSANLLLASVTFLVLLTASFIITGGFRSRPYPFPGRGQGQQPSEQAPSTG